MIVKKSGEKKEEGSRDECSSVKLYKASQNKRKQLSRGKKLKLLPEAP